MVSSPRAGHCKPALHPVTCLLLGLEERVETVRDDERFLYRVQLLEVTEPHVLTSDEPQLLRMTVTLVAKPAAAVQLRRSPTNRRDGSPTHREQLRVAQYLAGDEPNLSIEIVGGPIAAPGAQVAAEKSGDSQ